MNGNWGVQLANFQDLPAGKYFISHSYKDASVRETFLKLLPDHVKPYIFPPISVSPLEFVSSTLIGAILACDGLIYLNEGSSQNSFWVAFERDYALRSKKMVFGFTPSTQTFYKHTDPQLDLAIFPSYSHRQEKEIRPILDFMRQQRHFDPWIDAEVIKPMDNWRQVLEEGMENIFKRGGYVVSFVGNFNSQYTVEEMKKGLEQRRLMVAGLGTEQPQFLMPYNDLFIQLIENGRINNNRIDDLIVRLYWLMFRVQFPQYAENR